MVGYQPTAARSLPIESENADLMYLLNPTPISVAQGWSVPKVRPNSLVDRKQVNIPVPRITAMGWRRKLNYEGVGCSGLSVYIVVKFRTYLLPDLNLSRAIQISIQFYLILLVVPGVPGVIVFDL